MTTFDEQIGTVGAFVDEMRAKGRPARVFTCPLSVPALEDGLPVRVGPGANPGIILRGDTFVELGNPSAGSCAFVLWTTTPSLIGDGRITLIGPDIQEVPGGSLPFGQVLLVGGRELDAEAHQSVGQAQYVADQIEGYMVKSSSRSMWSRVSTDAGAKGFCFETLGRALMAIYRSTVAKVEAMEIVFVTSGKEDVVRLGGIASQVHDIGAEIVKEHWKAKGYDLDCDLDCRSCHDKAVCDDIRQVIAAQVRREREAAAKPVS